MKAQPIPINFNRGVNLLDDPAAIKDDEVVKAKNLWMKKQGLIAKRPAMGFAERIWQAKDNDPQTVVRDFAFLPGSNANSVVVIEKRGANDAAVLYPPVFYSPSYLGTPKEQSLGPSTYVPQIVQYGNRTFIFNGQSNGLYLDPADVDAQGQFNFKSVTWSTNTANTVNPALATVVRERFWYANLGAGYEDYIIVSDVMDPETIEVAGVDPFAVGGRAFQIGKAGEGAITAIAELSSTKAGSEASTMVAVWKGDKMFLITGEPLETNDVGDILGNMEVIRVNTNAGCVSHRTVVATPYGTFWAGLDDVWCMPHGGQPMRVGTKIRPALQATPPTLAYLWHAAYDEGHYKLAVFSDGLGPSDSSACDEQWWLDLRPFTDSESVPSASDCRWLGPQKYVQSSSEYPGTWNMRLDTRPGQKRRLVAVLSYRVGYMPGNYFRGLSLVSFDVSNNRDTVAPYVPYREWQASESYSIGDTLSTYTNKSGDRYEMQTYINNVGGTSGLTRPIFEGNTDYLGVGGDAWIGNAVGGHPTPATLLEPPALQTGWVLFEVITKEVAFDPMVDKLWDGLEVGYYASQPMKLRYVSIIDYELDARTAYMEGLPKLDSMVMDTDVNIGRKFRTRLLPPSNTKRSVGNTAQVRLYDEPCIIIQAPYNILRVYVNLDSTLFDIDLTGEYDNIHDVASAISNGFMDARPDLWPAGLGMFGKAVFVINNIGIDDFTIKVAAGYGVTAAQAASNAWLLNLFGFPIVEMSVGAGLGVEGLPTYLDSNAATVELSGLNHLYRVFKRRPQ